MLAEKHKSEIQALLAKYPADQKRSAVMPMLFLAQREYGHITPAALMEIAELLDMEPTEVGSLVGFYTLYHDKKEGKHRIQVCTDLPCALRGADKFAQELCEILGIKMGETTEDGKITVEEVMCLACCDKAPMFQVQSPDGIHYHENQTVESAMKIIEELRQEDGDA
ncbi:MAG: NAD(P)H-dependent oxidoreductase subunit E [Anaerolineales bacterium]